MFELFWKATAINLLAFVIYFFFLIGYSISFGVPDLTENRSYYNKLGMWLFLTVASVFVTVVWFIIRL